MTRVMRDGLGCLLLAGATLAGALSLDELVASATWLTHSVLVLAVAAATLILARAWSRSPWLASLLGLLTALTALGLTYAPGTQWLLLLPGPQTLSTLYRLGDQGIADAATTAAPVTDSTGLALLITGAAVIIFILAEALAIGGRTPAWSGIALLAPWAPAVALDVPVPTGLFVVAGGCYLLLLAAHTGADRPIRRRRRAASAAAGAALAAVCALAVALVSAPALLHVPSPRIDGEFSGSGSSGDTRLSLGLDVTEHLDRGPDELLYTYSTSATEDVGPLHAYTLTEFDGERWDRGSDPDDVEAVGSQALWPAATPPGTADFDLDVTIESLGQDRLLIPGEPRRLSIDGEWDYDSERDEVIGSGSTPLDYQVQVRQRQVSATDLQGAEVGDVGAEHLAVPQTGYGEQIAEVTREVVEEADAQTPYEQAVAIQEYLRRDSQFNYSVSVEPPRTSDAVWDFLNSGEGYCVQFGTAMVMMLRTLEIPSRLAVGFLEGEERADGVVEVSGHRAHAWPQVHFADIGWMRFEPTPPVRTGERPEWTQEDTAQTSEPSEQDTSTGPAPMPESPDEELDSSDRGSAVDPAAEEGQGEPVLLGLALLVMMAGVLATAWWLRSRGTRDEVEASWHHVQHLVTERAQEPVGPHATVRAVSRAADLQGPAAHSMQCLATAVETYRYAPPGRRHDVEQIRQWAAEVLTAVRQRHPR